MLSFDITDRNIRVVKGVESNGKIKISSAATLNVEEGLIVNGHVKDVPNVATLINGVLKRNKMPDKEAIVSISSNLTIFKEMTVTKAKNQDLQKVVKQQMQAELNLDDTYSVSYIIVGEAEKTEESAEAAYKVLATACPNEIINSYREVFKLLGISLRSVMIGCNCITKVLLADTKIKSKMPLLAVQIDNNFISLNLYEQGQLSFSRFASIDAADYGNSPDYVFEAVNENIFRMLQFHRTRNTGETIENVIFYGDTHDYVRLTDELEKLDLKTSLINVPPQIHGHENLEFSLYANAIGAMFKRNKEIEKINLLETDLGTAVKNKIKSDSSGNLILAGAVIAAALIVGGGWLIQTIRSNSVKNDIEEIQEYLDSQKTKDDLALQARLLTVRDQTQAQYDRMNNAYSAYMSQPEITREKWEGMIKTASETYIKCLENAVNNQIDDLDLEDDEKKALKDLINELIEEEKKELEESSKPDSTTRKTWFVDNGINYDNGQMSIEYTVPAIDPFTQKFPAELVQALHDFKVDGQQVFGAITYNGYTVEEAQESEDGEEEGLEIARAKVSLSFQMNGKQSAYVPEETEEAE